MSGLISRASDSTLSLMARQFGVLAMSAFRAGMQELEVNCAIPKFLRLLGLAQAGHQRRRGQVTPDHNERPAIAIDTVIGERHLLAEIEQALVKPPARILRRHIGHGTNFRRQPKIEAAPLNDNAPATAIIIMAALRPTTLPTILRRLGPPNRNGVSMNR